jgi:hypothetical protein
MVTSSAATVDIGAIKYIAFLAFIVLIEISFMLFRLLSVYGTIKKNMSHSFTPFFRANSSPAHMNPGEIG